MFTSHDAEPIVAANEPRQRSAFRALVCVCVGGVSFSGSAAKSLTDGVIQDEPSASCWQTGCERENTNPGNVPL